MVNEGLSEKVGVKREDRKELGTFYTNCRLDWLLRIRPLEHLPRKPLDSRIVQVVPPRIIEQESERDSQRYHR